MNRFRAQFFAIFMGLVLAMSGGGLAPSALAQQVETVDPNWAIDADLASPPPPRAAPLPAPAQAAPPPRTLDLPPEPNFRPSVGASAGASSAPASQDVVVAAEADKTYRVKHLVAEAEGVFGKGSEGLARIIEDILRKQGEPNGYIVGGEGGGAFVVGLRYGKGTLFHKIEGQRPVYWTGPSVGFDVGGNAGKTFVLVYNLFDSEELYERFPAGEGQAYLVGGFHASYLRRGDIVLIPIRMGAGLRLGVNAGYMKFSKKRKILPF